MKTTFRKLVLLSMVLLGSTAYADPVAITAINMEVRTSGHTVTGGDTLASLLAQFNAGGAVCNVSLGAVDNVGSTQTCGGPNNNIATLISVDINQGANTFWQFGSDWGRGGIIFATGGINGDTGPITGDFWWNFDWNNSFQLLTGPASYTLNFLGFEGCCAGGMSLRYSTDNRETWTIAAVNAVAVSEPGTLGLLGLGLAGLCFSRRRKKA